MEEEEKEEKEEVGVIVPVCRGTAAESLESHSQQTLKRGTERVSELAKVTLRGWQSGLQRVLECSLLGETGSPLCSPAIMRFPG